MNLFQKNGNHVHKVPESPGYSLAAWWPFER
jgi:hypothetical protein